MKRKILIVLLLIIASAMGFFFSKEGLMPQKTSLMGADQLAKRAEEKCGEEVNWPLCYTRELEETTYNYGSEKAYQTLFAIQEIEPRLKAGCHTIAHGIGWGIYKRNPSKALIAITKANPICSYGELMGILERYMSNLPGGELTKEDIPRICEKDPGAECNHALGHMFLVNTGDNLERAIDMCSALTDTKQRTICYSGVFMERIIGSNLYEHGLSDGYLSWKSRFNDHEALCRNQTDPYFATACWRIAPIMGQYSIKDPQKMFEFCNTAQTREAAWSCKMHFVTLANSAESDFNKLRPICRLDASREPTFERECYKYMAIIRINGNSLESGQGTVPFCSSLPPEYKNSCFWGIGHGLVETKTAAAKRKSFCKNAPQEYRRLCLGEFAEQKDNTVLHDMILPGELN